MINLITSLNSELYKKYGKNFFESYERFSANDIQLIVVFEGEIPQQLVKKYKKINFIRFNNEKHSRFLSYFGHFLEAKGLRIQESNTNQFSLNWDYRFDAIRFSFKIFSIDIVRNLLENNSPFAWIDADVKCLKNFSSKELLYFMPDEDQLMSYLGRTHFPLAPSTPYSECGFLGFNPNHPYTNNFIDRMIEIYCSGEIFSKKEWHDSWIWDEVRREFEQKSIKFKNISGKYSHTHHPFINCGLGNFFDHLKGPTRKEAGKSFEDDYSQI